VKIRLILFFILFFAMLWIAGFSIFSFIPKENSLQAIYPFVKMSYGRVCHQLPGKSFCVNGTSFLICARCTGIYVGSFVGFLFFLLVSRNYFSINIKYVTAASLLFLADVFINNFLLTAYNKTGAFITGYLFSFFALNFIIFEVKRNNFFHSSQRDT